MKCRAKGDRMHSFTGEAGKRLDHFLQEKLSEYSRSRIQSWIKEGRVLVNGAAAKASLLLRGGERSRFPRPVCRRSRRLPKIFRWTFCTRTRRVIAVNKPAGLVVHAGAGCMRGRWSTGWCITSGALSQLGGELRPGIVHRLDKDTSGVLLVARTDAAHRALAAQFAGRTVEKTYLALVHGKVRADSGRITKPIARDPVRRTRMTARLGVGARGADRISGAAAFREVHVSGSADRNGADAPDPGASGEHRASGGGGSHVWGSAGGTIVPACVEDRLYQPGDGRTGDGGGSAAAGTGSLAGGAIILSELS